MNFLSAMDAAASAMSAERTHMDVISSNIANANTTNTTTGMPYMRKVAVIEGENAPAFALPVSLDDDDDGQATVQANGVKVAGVAEQTDDLKWVYDPTNPNSQKSGKMKGYVCQTNVNVIREMTDLISASRSYDANATVVDAVKGMAMKGLQIGQG